MFGATVSSRSCLCWLYRDFPSSATKNTLSLILVLTIWWCPYGKSVFAIISVFSWQNSVRLCPASLYTPRPNSPVTSGVSWLPTLAFQSPMMKRTFFFGVNSRRSGSYSYFWSTSAPLPLAVEAETWITVMFCLGNELRSFCRLWGYTQVLHFGLFCCLWGLLHFSWGILAHSSRYNGHLN